MRQKKKEARGGRARGGRAAAATGAIRPGEPRLRGQKHCHARRGHDQRAGPITCICTAGRAVKQQCPLRQKAWSSGLNAPDVVLEAIVRVRVSDHVASRCLEPCPVLDGLCSWSLKFQCTCTRPKYEDVLQSGALPTELQGLLHVTKKVGCKCAKSTLHQSWTRSRSFFALKK